MSNLIDKEDIFKNIGYKRFSYNPQTKSHSEMPHATGKRFFIKGPIYLDWVSAVAKLPGKCLHVALAIQWLSGMSSGEPIKLTRKALKILNVSNDTTGDCLKRMEQAGLIHMTRCKGQRPTIRVIDLVLETPKTEYVKNQNEPNSFKQ